jgi:Fe-S cluster assembly protein SufD
MSIPVSPDAILDGLRLSVTYSDMYLHELLSQVSQTKSLGWLQELRDRAAHWVSHETIPTSRNEEWRFTELASLCQTKFQLAQKRSLASLPEEFTLPESAHSRLVFVNGIYAAELSDISDLPAGVSLSNISQLPENEIDDLKQYLAQSEGNLEVFTALNTAGLNDLALVRVKPHVVVESPIHLLFISSVAETPTISQPRCLVIAEDGSQLSLVEEYANWDAHLVSYFTNSVTEIWIAKNAQVNHTRVVREGAKSFHIGKTAVTQSRHSRYSCLAIAFGCQLSRHNLEIWQTGEQTETTLNGLTVIGSRQLADTHSAIALNHPHAVSRQLHKFIISDRAHGVFNGKIIVPKAAQLTDASQLNRNLLLSPKARIDTKPQLEITADNVKCAHGATVSQLEDEEIFYLQARGIKADDARNLLVNAFAQEILHQIPFPSLRNNLIQKVRVQESRGTEV